MARPHYVVCLKCGKTFDANKGGYYNAVKQRYICSKCGKAHNKAVKAENKEQAARGQERNTGMKQSLGAMIAKIAVGCLFLVVSFGMDNAGEVCVGLILAAALIAWGLVPYFMAKKKQEELRRQEARKKKVCPACGATTRGNTCEYCGSDLSEAD